MGMFDAGKKKSESFKPLSEVEIQKKLYGTLRPPHLFDQTASSPQAAGSGTLAGNEKLASEDFFSGSMAAALEKPASDTGAGNQEKKAVKSGTVKGINQWLEEESEILDKNLANTRRSPSVNYGKSTGGNSLVSKGVGGVFDGVLYGIQQGGVLILRLFQAFRSSWNKSASKLAVVGLVLALILGVQTLNNQREAAMKNPPSVSMPKIVISEQSVQDALTVPENTRTVAEPAKTETKADSSVEPTAVSPGQLAASSLPGTPPVEEAAAKPYVIQVATYVNLSDAQKMLEGIQKMGFAGFIQSMKRQTGRVYHCVFLGRFMTYDESDQILRKFKKLPLAASFPDVFIRKLK